jgi:hypothetical protein
MHVNFIQKLLTRTDDAMVSEFPAFIYDPTEAPTPAPPAREVLAVEHAHGVIVKTMAALRDEEKTLVDEINSRMERLRQVRVTLRAVGNAHDILEADMQNPAAEPPMPQTVF